MSYARRTEREIRRRQFTGIAIRVAATLTFALILAGPILLLGRQLNLGLSTPSVLLIALGLSSTASLVASIITYLDPAESVGPTPNAGLELTQVRLRDSEIDARLDAIMSIIQATGGADGTMGT